MSSFVLHTIETAPEEAKPLLEQANKGYGMVPGLYQVMASSPELLKSYFSLHEHLDNSDLTVEERNTALLTISVENECHYCVPAHTFIALSDGVSEEVVNALRENKPIPNVKLEALRTLTLTLLRNRGRATQEEMDAFLAAGYQSRHILDILIAIAQKTLSNYTNHLANTKIDAPFEQYEWASQR